MANVLERQVIHDGWRNAAVKLTGVIDSADASELPALALSDLTSNDKNLTLVGLRVDRVQYSVGPELELQLEWGSNSPQQIAALSSQGGKIKGECYGGFVPDRTRSGYDGSINLRTTGFPPGTVQNFTIVLEMVKLYV